MELIIKDIIIVIDSFIIIFYMLHTNSKTLFKQHIRRFLDYLLTCSEKEYEDFIEDVTEARKETK